LRTGLSEQVPRFGILYFDTGLDHQLIGFIEDAGDQFTIEQG
jgi:hypothetical protein